jgi:metallo-beta-lactamase class B
MSRPATLILAAIVAIAGSRIASSQSSPSWTEPFPPFRIAGNLYYVGSRGLANYLITTSQGHILINSDLEANVPLIRASIEQLGFKFSDVKILLISHAHWDHDAGSAKVKELTGAKYMVMDADVPVVESGGKSDFQYGNDPAMLYTPVHVDRVLHDGDEVKLGDAVLVAHLTPGHTKGCTTWTLTVRDGQKTYSAVIIGSPNVNPGYKLVANGQYPAIAQDYEKGFRVLKSLNCQIFLGAHGGYFDLEAKYARFRAGRPDAFVDPAGCAAFVAQKEQEFRSELAKQTVAQPHGLVESYEARYAAVKRCLQHSLTVSPTEVSSLGEQHRMYTLWRGGKCLGYFEEQTPVMGKSGPVGASGILVPNDGMEGTYSMMQTRSQMPPNTPTFQDSLPIDFITDPPRPPTLLHPSSVALEPLSPEAARGVPPEKQYEIRDERGEKLDVDLVTLELHRFGSPGLAKQWRDANGIRGDAQEYWTVMFALHQTNR